MTSDSSSPRPEATPLREQGVVVLLTLATFALRLWALDSKGLSYDEAATALMARAGIADIVRFHWDAAFEHPPLWQITMHLWSALLGQSAAALRLPSAFASTLLIPLTWRLLRQACAAPVGHAYRALALLALALLALSPVLLVYGQEARMYALVVSLATASLWLTLRLAARPGPARAAGFILVNWAMLGFHYYAGLLLAAEGVYLAAVGLWQRRRSAGWWAWLLGSLALSVTPILLWMAMAPGFQETLAVVLREADAQRQGLAAFLGALWQDLAFGSFRWQPSTARTAYLLLPVVGLGLGIALWHGCAVDRRRGRAAIHPEWLLALAALLPVAVSAVAFRTLSTRYILYVAPLLWLFAAVAVTWLWRRSRVLGALAFLVAVTPALAGVAHYLGPFQRSQYREAAAWLNQRVDPAADIVVLQAPRQHLLARYYLSPEIRFVPEPRIPLPEYWPVTAPRLAPEEMDDHIQEYLHTYDGLWLVLAGENEVDPGEILLKYLNAVAYKVDCHKWLDVHICRFVSPQTVTPEVEQPVDAVAGNELSLESAALSLRQDAFDGGWHLLAQLDWQAVARPTADYKVSVRVVDGSGQVVAQHDDFPIGDLLPPTTWTAGDRKPGYAVLALPAELPPGDYAVTVHIYDPATLAPVPLQPAAGSAPAAASVVLADLRIDDRMALLPAGSGSR